MKEGINPVIAGVIIVLVVAVAGFFIWKGMGPRSDGPSQPINMGTIIGKDKIAPQAPKRPTNMGRSAPQ